MEAGGVTLAAAPTLAVAVVLLSVLVAAGVAAAGAVAADASGAAGVEVAGEGAGVAAVLLSVAGGVGAETGVPELSAVAEALAESLSVVVVGALLLPPWQAVSARAIARTGSIFFISFIPKIKLNNVSK